MSIRSAGSIRLPKSPAGHFDHFDIVGLETFVARANAGHARRCDGPFLGENPGADKSEEQCRYPPTQPFTTEPADVAHAILRIWPSAARGGCGSGSGPTSPYGRVAM